MLVALIQNQFIDETICLVNERKSGDLLKFRS